MDDLEQQNSAILINSSALKGELDSKENEFCELKSQLTNELEQIRKQYQQLKDQFTVCIQ